MGTQGLITITANTKPVAKIIVGCNGQEINDAATELAKLIEENKLFKNGRINLQMLYATATKARIGCKDCLVVMDSENIVRDHDAETKFEEEDRLRYFEYFSSPRFNPRWKYGTAEHIAIIRIEDYKKWLR